MGVGKSDGHDWPTFGSQHQVLSQHQIATKQRSQWRKNKTSEMSKAKSFSDAAGVGWKSVRQLVAPNRLTIPMWQYGNSNKRNFGMNNSHTHTHTHIHTHDTSIQDCFKLPLPEISEHDRRTNTTSTRDISCWIRDLSLESVLAGVS